ncbi:MAG: LppX_LprAFG lipoprotein [Actinomycetales bacterium]|nr:LppX_LprAFG lipoprotein [Actinomycetales bacterium]
MRRSLSLLFVFSLVAGLTLGACSEAKPKEKARTAEQIIQDIGDEFATANDLEFDLNTEKLPGDVNGIKNAVGAGNRSPAFIGTVDLITGGVAVGAEIIAADGQGWAKTGLSPDMLLIDPAALDAPEPALLVGTGDNGLVAIFSSATGLSAKGKSREGNLVLETITGTVPGELMAGLLPTASAKSSFSVEFRVTEKGAFHDLYMTGEFYQGHKTTYRLKMSIPTEPVVVIQPTEQ